LYKSEILHPYGTKIPRMSNVNLIKVLLHW